MRIGVISDTHGDTVAVRRAIDAAGKVEEWIHLGDFESDAAAIAAKTRLPMHSVKGNCDGTSRGELEAVINICGARIFITHGHKYGVNYSLHELYLRACELGCDAALFGHTHIPHTEKQGDVLILNPGSPHRPLGGFAPSIAVLTVTDGVVSSEMIKV